MSERAGIEVSERGNEGIDRRNDAGKGDDDLTEVGNDVYTARNVVGERVATDRRLVVSRMAVRTAVAARSTKTILALLGMACSTGTLTADLVCLYAYGK